MAAAVAAATLTAFAQPAVAQDQVDARNFRPAVGPFNVFSIEGADILGHMRFTGGVLLDYASEPLVLSFPDRGSQAVVDQQLAAHVLTGVGLYDIAQLNLVMPVYLVNDGSYGTRELRGATVGDVELRAKFGFLSAYDGPVGVAAVLAASFPTGNSEDFVGSAGVTTTPMLVADTMFQTPAGEVRLAANVGARLQGSHDVHDTEAGSQLIYGGGAELTLVDGLLTFGGELYGGTQFGDFFGSNSPLEGNLGVKITPGNGITILAGSGGGLVSGLGTPSFRAFLGLSYTHPLPSARPAPDSYDDALEDDELPADDDGVDGEALDSGELDGEADDDGMEDDVSDDGALDDDAPGEEPGEENLEDEDVEGETPETSDETD